MMASKPVATPIEQNHRLSEALEEMKVDRKMYQRHVRDSFILHILGQT